MSESIDIHEWQGRDEEIEEAGRVYAETFAEEPYLEDPLEGRQSFIERTTRYRDWLPDFRLLVASHGSGVVGLVLGTGISGGNWWYDQVITTLSPKDRERWVPPSSFSVGELAVAPSSRGQGIGARLMRGVVQDLPYATALLGCDPKAVPARTLYLVLLAVSSSGV